MNDLFIIIKNTPWWVFILFAYISFLSFKMRKSRDISIYYLWVVPWFLFQPTIHATPIVLALFKTCFWAGLLPLLPTFLLSWFDTRNFKVYHSNGKTFLHMTKSWITPLMLFTFFGLKFYLGYAIATAPIDLKNSFIFYNQLVTQLIVGFALGKIFALLNKLRIFSSQRKRELKKPLV